MTSSDAAQARITGPSTAGFGDADRPDPEGGHSQQLAPLDQVRGEEDGQRDLGELTGLEVDRAEADPDAGAVDVATDHRQQRHEQQEDAADHERVAVALEHPGVPDDEQHGGERGDPDCGPDGLERGQVFGEPGDDHVAQAVEERGDRETGRDRPRGRGGG